MSSQSWVRLDVGYFSNRKVLRAGRDAALLHLAAICYLGAEEDDVGILPGEMVEVLARLTRIQRPAPVVERLVKQGLWHEADRGDYLVHDYDRMNGARSEAGASRERKRRQRAKQRAEREGQRP